MPSSTVTDRQAARVIGVLFLLTFVTAIGGYAAYAPLLDDPNWAAGGAADDRILVGALLEVFLVVTNIATAIVLFPILRRTHERLAFGWVASRVVESTLIAVGIVSLLAVVKANAAGSTAQGLVAAHDATFLLGPGFCVAIGNGLLLGYAMLRSGLLPRRLAMIGLVGGSLCFVNATGALFGGWEQMSPVGGLLSFPEMVWEAGVLGIYLIAKGFSAPTASGPAAEPLAPTRALATA